MTKKPDNLLWVLRLGWWNPPPWNNRQTYTVFTDSIDHIYERIRCAIKLVNGSTPDNITNLEVKCGENESRFVTFDAGDRKWDYHLYRDIVGATRLKKFQPAKTSIRRR